MRRSLGAACLLGLGLVGCGREPVVENHVPLDQVPPAALKAAEEALPDVTFQAAWREDADGAEAYEIRGQTKQGRIRDTKVTADGRVLEVD